MDIHQYTKTFKVNFLIEKEKTILTIEKDIYELPFMIPVGLEEDNILFGKVFDYILNSTVKNGKVIKAEGNFLLYYIELYADEFNKAIEEFKKLISLSSIPLMKEVIIKSFFNIIEISNKSYNKVYLYVNHDKYYDSLGTFRQYCGLE